MVKAIKFTSPAEKLYCDRCCGFVDYKVTTKKEIYKVKGTDEIEIEAQVAVCANCGNELFDIYLEDQNLKKAFKIYAERHRKEE